MALLCLRQKQNLDLLLQTHKTIGNFPHAVSSLHNLLCRITSLNLDRVPSNQCSYTHSSDVLTTPSACSSIAFSESCCMESIYVAEKNQGRPKKPYKEAIESNARSRSNEQEERAFSTKALQSSMKTSKTYC